MGRPWNRTKDIFESSGNNIIQDYEAGFSLAALADRYEVSPPTISSWLALQGYRRRGRGRVSEDMVKRAVELSNRGWSPLRIAKLFRVDPETISSWTGVEYEPAVEIEENEEFSKHVRGKRWTEAQEAVVYGLLASGLSSPGNIYSSTGASKRKQMQIWESRSDAPFPFTDRTEQRIVRKTIAEVAYALGVMDAINFTRGTPVAREISNIYNLANAKIEDEDSVSEVREMISTVPGLTPEG